MMHWHPLPAAIYSFVEQTPGTVLLENSRPGANGISRLFTAPLHVSAIREFSELPSLFKTIEDAVARDLFVAGYFAYACGQYFEPTANLGQGDKKLLAWFGVYDRCCRFDHVAGGFLDAIAPDLESALGTSVHMEFNRPSEVRFGLTEQEFIERIAQIHEWLRAGDIYQLNFTFCVHAQITESPAELYRRLARSQPVDYGAFLHCLPGCHILSLSPELFFRIDGSGATRRITARPMKGTARRGRTTGEDDSVASWLRNDFKNRAENVMIVDLIRNDLGRLCTYGSVRVEKLFDVERYPTLWQMTSTITGEIRPGIDYEQILRALFPCGSVTGAPKVRAMQLLAQIEAGPRDVYTGSIGYFSREQTVFNVVIRTLSLEDGVGTMGVGSGIVIDSNPKVEYQECHLKAEFLTRPLENFSLIETMLWDGGYPLLDLHLDRLADSASYFDRPCDRVAIREALLAQAGGFPNDRPRKVRLLLDVRGLVSIDSEGLFRIAEVSAEPVRACMAARRTDPADRFLFHKTTRRGLYDAAFANATAAGFADAIFLNTRDEITEGAISNLFIEKSGRWYTPPLDCGVLPGVSRRHLLESRSDIRERILTIDDLKAADCLYISNAVRGLRKVAIDFDSTV